VDFTANWLKFLRAHITPVTFPREVGFPKRVTVTNRTQYIESIRRHNGKDDCFVSLFSNPQINHRTYDCIFLDFDDESGTLSDDVIRDVREAIVRVSRYTKSYALYYSGNRGFHLYLYFEPVRIKHFKRTCREFVQLLGLDEISTLDFKLVGDVRRLCRLPYTIHPTTGLYVVRITDVTLRFTRVGIFRISNNPDPSADTEVQDDSRLSKMLLTLDGIDVYIPPPRGRVVGEIPEDLPPCIVFLIDKLKSTGYLKHHERFHLASFLLRYGVHPDVVVDLFRRFASDYDPHKCRYQVEHIATNMYKCYSCANAKMLGMCPLGNKMETCPWYPSPNWFI